MSEKCYPCFSNPLVRSVGSKTNANSTLLGIPKISPFGFSETSLGSEVKIACIPSVKSSLTWLVNGREIRDGDDGMGIEEVRGMLVLTIGRLRPEHSGNYTCVGTNADGTGSFSASLSVPYPPKWSEIPDKHVIIPRTLKTKVLNCAASGSPQPQITWFRNGGIRKAMHVSQNSIDCAYSKRLTVVLSRSVHFQVNVHSGSKFSLRIGDNNVPGSYGCRASNEFGTIDHDFRVSVFCKPNFSWRIHSKSMNR